LEGAVDGVAGEERFAAQGFVGLLAEVAGEAGAVDPLHAGVVAAGDESQFGSSECRARRGLFLHLDILDQVTLGDNDTSTLVSADEWKLGGKWPVSVHGVQVGVAYTGKLDVDEDFIGAGLLDGNLLVNDWTSCLLDDLRPLLLWDRHIGLVLCCGRCIGFCFVVRRMYCFERWCVKGAEMERGAPLLILDASGTAAHAIDQITDPTWPGQYQRRGKQHH
jgi:hypothetical protein